MNATELTPLQRIEILEDGIDHQTDWDIISILSGSNPDDGFLTRQEASEYVRKRKEWWGSNLIGWVEEKDGKFFPCFNVWD